MKILLLLLSLCSFAVGQTIEERVDKFKDGKKYVIDRDRFRKNTRVGIDMTLQASRGEKRINQFIDSTWTVVINDDGSADAVQVMFLDEYRRWFEYPILHLMIDDDVLRFEDDAVDRISSFILKPEHLQRIARARTVELQIETFETRLDEKTMTKLRNLASLINLK